MEKLELKNYELWKNCNKEFTKLDYLFGIIIKFNLHPDFLALYCQLFFPKFLLINNMIFFEFSFQESSLKRLVSAAEDPKKIEYWMNLIIVTSFFPNDMIYDSHAEYICKMMEDSISKKLEAEFKDKKFKIIIGNDEDDGYFFTFHQI